ncbi:hypothetical protein ES705_39502 [subsurface metagenome]
MSLKKPIETLEAIRHTGHYQPTVDDVKAVELGIEALKRLQELRTPSSGNPHLLLPGETSD